MSLYQHLRKRNHQRLHNRRMRYQQWFQETELALTKLSETVGNSKLNPVPVTEFYTENMDADREELLRILFDDFGSDKAELGYHHIYSRLFPKPQKISNVFEIGLGTNNLDVPSNMGKDGVPGASLLAFQDFFPNADIHGADIDKRILFDRDRIHTHYVDQRSYQSFNNLPSTIGSSFDLMIDDGLHAPQPNINSLSWFLTKLSEHNGIAVIEDIQRTCLPIWEIVSVLIGRDYQSQMVQCPQSYVYIVRSTS